MIRSVKNKRPDMLYADIRVIVRTFQREYGTGFIHYKFGQVQVVAE